MNYWSKSTPSVKKTFFNELAHEVNTNDAWGSYEDFKSYIQEVFPRHCSGNVDKSIPKIVSEFVHYVKVDGEHPFIVNLRRVRGLANRLDAFLMASKNTENVGNDEEEEDEAPSEMRPQAFRKSLEIADATQAAEMAVFLEDEEKDIEQERIAIKALAEKQAKQSEALAASLQELKKKEQALKKKEEEVKKRKDLAQEHVTEKMMKRVREENDDAPQGSPPIKKQAFKAFFSELDAAQKNELVDAEICDKNGNFNKQQSLTRASRDEFKGSQLNKLVELHAIVKNW